MLYQKLGKQVCSQIAGRLKTYDLGNLGYFWESLQIEKQNCLVSSLLSKDEFGTCAYNLRRRKHQSFQFFRILPYFLFFLKYFAHNCGKDFVHLICINCDEKL